MRSRVSLAAAGTLILVIGATGCATTSRVSSSFPERAPDSTNTISQIIESPESDDSDRKREIVVMGVRLKNTDFDYPVTINSRVEYWITYFTGRGRPHFERYLERSEHFIPYIQPLLRQHGMPEDLVYLAMIESGFNNHARSRAKAVGPWQFISATGKRYGLMVNWWVDERRDTRKSTLAAIRYLKDLHDMFQSWELAAAAYNAGETKVARAIQRYGTKDFWQISRQRFFRPETRDYVPKIIAAALIAKNREQFGFSKKGLELHEGEAIAADGEVVKLEAEDPSELDPNPIAEETIADILKHDGDETESRADLASSVAEPLAKPAPTPHVSRKGEVGSSEMSEFDIQGPADLLKVSRAAGLSYNTVKSLNPELLRWCTPPGLSTYRVRLPADVKDRFLATYNHAAFPRKVEFMKYKVRNGETLSRIARHYGIHVDPISDLNGFGPRQALRSGIQIRLPLPNDRTRSLASLEVRDPPERRRRKGRSGRRSLLQEQAGPTHKVTLKRRQEARSAPRGDDT